MMHQTEPHTHSRERMIGLDMLKGFAMLLVVLNHAVIHGGLLAATQPMSAHRMVAYALYTAAFCAVNCYGMISGYVGVSSRQRYSGLAMQHLRVIFYTVLISLAMKLLFPSAVTKRDLIKGLFPYVNNAYWYYTAYLPTALLAPYINLCSPKRLAYAGRFILCVWMPEAPAHAGTAAS